jgi:hypothetical protein
MTLLQIAFDAFATIAVWSPAIGLALYFIDCLSRP